MELLLFLFGLAAILSMIFGKREATEGKDEVDAILPTESGLNTEKSLCNKQVSLVFSANEQIEYLREIKEDEDHALILEAKIKENSIQPDEEGYCRNADSWWGNFSVVTKDGRNYCGRIKILPHYIIGIRNSSSKDTLFLKNISKVE